MASHLQTWVSYFSAHPEIALAAVFAASLLEALALIGTVIPGSSVVFTGGILIGLGVLDPWWTGAIAVVGAIMGDGISYWLGHHYREKIRTVWPLKNHPELMERGQAYFKKNGGKSVFLGRFLGPVRAIVPVIAGMTGMPAPRFYAMNVASAFAWAAAHLLPGLLFGASLQLAGAVSSRLVILLLIVALALWAVSQLVQWAYRRGLPRLALLRDHAVARARRKPGSFPARLVLSLLDPARAASSALLTAVLLLGGGSWLLFAALKTVIGQDSLSELDQSVYVALQGLRTVWGDHLMVTVAEVGGGIGTGLLIAGVAALFVAGRRWRILGYWLGAVGVAEVFAWLLKFTLGHSRPDSIYGNVQPFPFQSGHTVLSIAVYGFLALFLSHGKSDRQKIAATLVAIVLIMLVAFARLYLGLHWFSHVWASVGVGLVWLALISIAYLHHLGHERIRSWPLLGVIMAALGLTAAFYGGGRHHSDVARYAVRPTLQAMPLDDWTGTGWRTLPASRSELAGESSEPFGLQWAGTAGQISGALRASGWQAPNRWTLANSLLWLLPTTQIGQLPVLPKFEYGEVQKITFIKVTDSGERLVLRLWPLHRDVTPDPALPPRPLWIGMVAMEHTLHPGAMLTLARTASDFNQPLRVLAQDAQNQHLSVQSRQNDGQTIQLV